MENRFAQIFKIIEKEYKEEKSLSLNSRVLIVDALNNFIRVWIVMPTVNDDGQHIGGITGFLQTLGVAIRALRPTRVFIVLDGKNASKRRKKLFPMYKENRGGGFRLNRAHDFADEEEEQKQMKYQMGRVIQYLKNLPVTFICIDNIEADDTIGYLTNMCQNKKELKELFIMSSDKDFYQLIDKRVKVWSPIKKEIIDEKHILDEYDGIHPVNFLLYKSIIGDKSDNIPGIRGLGMKTIAKHFHLLKEDVKHTPNDVIAYAKNNTDNIRAFKLIVDNSKQFLLNYKLMTLTSENKIITKSAAFKIINSFNRKIPKINLIHIQELVKHDKLWNAFKNINEWTLTNFSILNRFAKTS